MISLSSKCTYGLAALFELALLPEATSLSIKQIARAQAIPEDYLRQLIVSLKRSGLVKITRGKTGGCTLARPASEITIHEIIEKLDGPLELHRTKIKDPTIRSYLVDCQTKIGTIFSQTLEELAVERREQARCIVYNI